MPETQREWSRYYSLGTLRFPVCSHFFAIVSLKLGSRFPQPPVKAGLDEPVIRWRSVPGAALELGVELGGEEEVVIGPLHHLLQPAVGAPACELNANALLILQRLVETGSITEAARSRMKGIDGSFSITGVTNEYPTPMANKLSHDMRARIEEGEKEGNRIHEQTIKEYQQRVR